MALEIQEVQDPDFPDLKAYEIICPTCHKRFSSQSAKRTRAIYINHRQTHNGAGTE